MTLPGIRCLEAVADGSVDAGSCVVPVPGWIGAAIASSYLDRKYPTPPLTPLFPPSPPQDGS